MSNIVLMRRAVPSEEGGEEEGDEEEEGGEEGQVCSIVYYWGALCELTLCSGTHSVSTGFSITLWKREREEILIYIPAL